LHAGGLFSVALAVVHPEGRLPVRKQDALCCPDFPPRRKTYGAAERFAAAKIGVFQLTVIGCLLPVPDVDFANLQQKTGNRIENNSIST